MESSESVLNIYIRIGGDLTGCVEKILSMNKYVDFRVVLPNGSYE